MSARETVCLLSARGFPLFLITSKSSLLPLQDCQSKSNSTNSVFVFVFVMMFHKIFVKEFGMVAAGVQLYCTDWKGGICVHH